MCWISDKYPTKNIATKNIICYKVFNEYDIILKERKFLGKTYKKEIEKFISLYSKYLYFPYKINSEISLLYSYSSPNKWYKSGLWSINKGYHSYETLNVTKRHTNEYCRIIECIIPKGSIYYINRVGHIVSSNIIVTDKIVK